VTAFNWDAKWRCLRFLQWQHPHITLIDVMKLSAVIALFMVLPRHCSPFAWARSFDDKPILIQGFKYPWQKRLRMGRMDKLDALHAQGADVNARGRDEMTATLWAVCGRSKRDLSGFYSDLSRRLKQ
jgi:hypothetical protein